MVLLPDWKTAGCSAQETETIKITKTTNSLKSILIRYFSTLIALNTDTSNEYRNNKRYLNRNRESPTSLSNKK